MVVGADGILRDPQYQNAHGGALPCRSFVDIPLHSLNTSRTCESSLVPLMTGDFSCGSPIDGNEPHSNNNEPDLVSQLNQMDNDLLYDSDNVTNEV